MSAAKSKITFQFNVAEFKTDIYMWTFTYREVLDTKDAIRQWRSFVGSANGLTDCFPAMRGLRVFEMHPGKDGRSHGLHVHLLVDKFLPVDIVRNLWGRGRVHVKQIKKEDANYIGKYLAKDRPPCLKGVRLWAPIGGAALHQIKDMVVQSEFTAAYQFLAGVVQGFRLLSWPERIQVTGQFIAGQTLDNAFHPEQWTEEGGYWSTWGDGTVHHSSDDDGLRDVAEGGEPF